MCPVWNETYVSCVRFVEGGPPPRNKWAQTELMSDVSNKQCLDTSRFSAHTLECARRLLTSRYAGVDAFLDAQSFGVNVFDIYSIYGFHSQY